MDPRFTSFSDLMKLTDRDIVTHQKILCIKIIRGITGEGLKEAKEFFEEVLQPAVLDKTYNPIIETKLDSKFQLGDPDDCDDFDEEVEQLPPPTFLIGHTYKQLNKEVVLILGVSNPNTSHETVYSMDGKGKFIHRYNRRDIGRVTGCDVDDPRNLIKPE